MNLQEFAALKAGDRVRNVFSGSTGEVTVVDKAGVRVRWDLTGIDFAFTAQSTAWMGWDKLSEPDQPDGEGGAS